MQLDQYFTSALEDSRAQSQLIGDYVRGRSANGAYVQRHWMIPTRASTFNPLSIASLGTAFSRYDLNLEYAQQLSGTPSDTSGCIGHTIADGLQINYLAMMERAFRERHKTDVRCQMHLAGRRLAHGDTNGVHTGAVKPYVQSFIDGAVTVPN